MHISIYTFVCTYVHNLTVWCAQLRLRKHMVTDRFLLRWKYSIILEFRSYRFDRVKIKE